jgi:hypothetical protein
MAHAVYVLHSLLSLNVAIMIELCCSSAIVFADPVLLFEKYAD